MTPTNPHITIRYVTLNPISTHMSMVSDMYSLPFVPSGKQGYSIKDTVESQEEAIGNREI
jgi:hypothetical protein